MDEDSRHLLDGKEAEYEDAPRQTPPNYSRAFDRNNEPSSFVIRHHRIISPLLIGLLIGLALALAAASIGFVWRLPKCIYRPPGAASCVNSVHFDSSACLADLERSKNVGAEGVDASWRFHPARDERDHSLTDAQCEAAFPGFFIDADEAAKRLHAKGQTARITQKSLDDQTWVQYTIRAMIYDGELYLISNDGVERIGHPFGHRAQASLHSLNTALLATREPLPNIEFALNDVDYLPPKPPYWAYTRKAEHENTWLMPDFGFYSWPEPGIGTYAEVRRRMAAVDAEIPSLADKIPKAFGRGNIHMAEGLRRGMLRAAEGKPWSDIQTLEWGNEEDVAANYVSIEDHCRYRFLIHTEGESYSGRLKYLLNCRSLIFAHRMQWIQPFEYLMVSSGEAQNFVELERDFSDLDAKVSYYLDHPDEVERIVENSVRTFRDRYVTPATTACHWRRLIRRYAEVSDRPAFLDGEGNWRGVPFESAALMGKLHWKPH